VLIRAQKASLLDAANYSTMGLTVAALTDCPVRIFLEKLTVVQLMNKSPAFYEPEDSLPPSVAFVSQLNHAHSSSLTSTSMFPIYALFFQVVTSDFLPKIYPFLYSPYMPHKQYFFPVRNYHQFVFR
jgi:hypothetical protein